MAWRRWKLEISPSTHGEWVDKDLEMTTISYLLA
jgi:hypothetical protein